MDGPGIIAQYENRLAELHVGLEHARLHGALAGGIFGIASLVVLLLGLYAVRQQISFLWASTPVPVAAAAALRLRRNQQIKQQVWRLRRFYERGVQRLRGNWVGNGFTGEEFEDPGHPYAEDLNIFGRGSLFELLCTARTAIGRCRLADYLLQAPHTDETILRQQAIQELAGRSDLRENLVLLGKFDFRESRWETFDEWLSLPELRHGAAITAILLITTAVLAAMLCGGIAGLIPWLMVAAGSAPLLVFHFIVGLQYQRRIRAILPCLRQVSLEIEVLRGGFQLLEGQAFQSAKLRGISNQARGAAKSLRGLERMLEALMERDKQWFYLSFLALCVTTQLCWAIDRWRLLQRDNLRGWLDAWAEFEALSALGNYALENCEHTFPKFSAEAPCFEAENLGHPLIPSVLRGKRCPFERCAAFLSRKRIEHVRQEYVFASNRHKLNPRFCRCTCASAQSPSVAVSCLRIVFGC